MNPAALLRLLSDLAGQVYDLQAQVARLTAELEQERAAAQAPAEPVRTAS